MVKGIQRRGLGMTLLMSSFGDLQKGANGVDLSQTFAAKSAAK